MGAVEAAHSISNLTDEISMATREQTIAIDRIIDALLDERRTAGEIHLANSTWLPATSPAVMTAVCRKPWPLAAPWDGAAGGS